MTQARFHELTQRSWTPAFEDPGTDDWRANWFLDGERAEIRNTPQGMVFAAGPVAQDNGSHAVLWTQQSFAGDVRVEFDFTRLDSIHRYVNILYIQATGKGDGPYTENIREWAHLRQVPFMSCYFNNMNLLHISYAAFGRDDTQSADYVRARRYPVLPDRPFRDTGLPPDHFETGLFLPGVPYHFTVMKTDADLFFEVKNDEIRKLFHWTLANIEPLRPGPVGIRHMWTRCSRYKDFAVWVL